jgi:hypothetical protein
MRSSAFSWIFGPKVPILPLTASAVRPTSVQMTAPPEKPSNRLGLDRLADSAEKGLAVPMCVVRVRESVFAV